VEIDKELHELKDILNLHDHQWESFEEGEDYYGNKNVKDELREVELEVNSHNKGNLIPSLNPSKTMVCHYSIYLPFHINNDCIRLEETNCINFVKKVE